MAVENIGLQLLTPSSDLRFEKKSFAIVQSLYLNVAFAKNWVKVPAINSQPNTAHNAPKVMVSRVHSENSQT